MLFVLSVSVVCVTLRLWCLCILCFLCLYVCVSYLALGLLCLCFACGVNMC